MIRPCDRCGNAFRTTEQAYGVSTPYLDEGHLCESCEDQLKRWFESNSEIMELRRDLESAEEILDAVEDRSRGKVCLDFIRDRLWERFEDELARIHHGPCVVTRYLWFDSLAECAASAAIAFSRAGWTLGDGKIPTLDVLVSLLRRLEREVGNPGEHHAYRFIVRSCDWPDRTLGRFAHENPEPIKIEGVRAPLRDAPRSGAV